MTTTQLLGTREYCNAIVAGRANITLRYLSGAERRRRRVGVRWFESGVEDGVPWVVRLVMDNCGLDNEYPVATIVMPNGPVQDTADANEAMFAIIQYMEGPATAETMGDALMVRFQAQDFLGMRYIPVLEVRRRSGEQQRPWEDILDATPSISDYESEPQAPEFPIMACVRERAHPPAR